MIYGEFFEIFPHIAFTSLEKSKDRRKKFLSTSMCEEDEGDHLHLKREFILIND